MRRMRNHFDWSALNKLYDVEKGKAAVTNSFQLEGADEDNKKFVDETTAVV